MITVANWISVLSLGFLASFSSCLTTGVAPEASSDYSDLVRLFEDWRAFERPPLRDGAPDYTAERLDASYVELADYRARLAAIDPEEWSIEQQVDWHLVRAELNGFEFNYRFLRPWARDPAFYQTVWSYESDTPAHEGPTHHGLLELWAYSFPLSAEEQARMTAELAVIPPLLAQARENLTGNARELWAAGIENIRGQRRDLDGMASYVEEHGGSDLQGALAEAQAATTAFVDWLEEQAPSKTGPSGIGKEAYDWNLRNVHLVPTTWEEEVTVLQRELDRAWSSLKLEEHRNRKLPPLESIESAREYRRRANDSVTKYIEFLDQQDILPVPGYYDAAIRKRIGQFVPKEERNFFWTAVHFEPMTLWTHFYHYFDLEQMREDPHASPIRRDPLLYNIWDSRAEGLATGVEEMMLLAGLYDDNPHAREIVYVMLAQRAARGLGSLYAHANLMTMQEAAEFHVEWTPRGWMRKDLDLLAFEQQLYLRQPGYGTSYITGKVLIENLMTERAKQVGDEDFTLKGFYSELNEVGVIPVSLIRWQLTGKDDQIRALTAEG